MKTPGIDAHFIHSQALCPSLPATTAAQWHYLESPRVDPVSLSLPPPASTVDKSRLASGLKAFNTEHNTMYVTLKELLDDHPGETRATVELTGQQVLGVSTVGGVRREADIPSFMFCLNRSCCLCTLYSLLDRCGAPPFPPATQCSPIVLSWQLPRYVCVTHSLCCLLPLPP